MTLRRRTPRFAAALLVIALVTSACTSGDSDQPSPGADPTGPTTPADENLDPVAVAATDHHFIRGVRSQMNTLGAEFPIVRGLYSTMHSFWGARWDGLLDLVRTTEVNAMVVDVREETGFLAWPMPTLELAGPVPAANWSDPRPRLRRLKALGGYAIARIVCMQDTDLAQRRPDLAIHNLATGSALKGNHGNLWLDPYAEEVWDYCADVGVQAIAMGFDEVQFDYVRFPNAGDGNISQLRFPNAPPDVEQARIQDPDVIVDGLNRAARKVQAAGGYASADVFGLVLYNYEWNVDGTGQVWERLATVFDYLSPMVYPSHYGRGNFGLLPHPVQFPYETVLGAMEEARVRSEGLRAKVRPWLEDFGSPWMGSLSPPHSPERVRAQIQATYDKGIESWLLWNAQNRFSEEALEPVLVPRAKPWERDPDQISGAGDPIRQLAVDENGDLVREVQPTEGTGEDASDG